MVRHKLDIGPVDLYYRIGDNVLRVKNKNTYPPAALTRETQGQC
jgi:hypothetical protein